MCATRSPSAWDGTSMGDGVFGLRGEHITGRAAPRHRAV